MQYLEERKQEIRDLFDLKNYTEQLLKCDLLFNEVSKEKEVSTNETLWFCCYEKAKTYLRKKNYKETMNNLKKSFKYQIEGSNYAKSLFLMAYMYKKFGNIEKAKNCYKLCNNYYDLLLENKVNKKSKELLKWAADVKQNIANIDHDELLLFKAQRMYQQAGVFEEESDNWYDSLCHTYIYHELFDDCLEIMKLIKDEQTYNDLVEELKTLNIEVVNY